MRLFRTLPNLCVCRSFGRLRQFLVLRQGHESPQLDQYGLHRELSLPLSEARQLCGVDLAVRLVNAGYVDFRDESYFWRLVGIVITAVNLEGVYAILMDALEPLGLDLGIFGQASRRGQGDLRGEGREWCRSSWS